MGGECGGQFDFGKTTDNFIPLVGDWPSPFIHGFCAKH